MRSFALTTACFVLALTGCSANGAIAPSAPAQGAPAAGAPLSAAQAVGRAVTRPLASSLGRPLATGTYKQLYAFKGTPDGASPYSGLAVINGALYGTTLNGSSNYCSTSCQSNDCYLGCGTVFHITEDGKENVAYNFEGNFNNAGDGTWAFDGMIAMNGTLYGTTSGGGGSGDHGTIFSVTPSGAEHVLYAFKGGSDGSGPEASLIALNGTLYGATILGGGSGCGGSGCGTVFAVSPTGSEHVVYAFAGGTDGANAYSGVTAMKGKLYGATLFGGGSGCGGRGCGAIYAVTTKGSEHVIYRFGGTTDGGNPNGLTAYKGTLYGTAESGGTRLSGLFFSVTKAGTEKVLYNFTDIPDGNLPGANLILVDGTFYGTTVGGGTAGNGTVFSVTPAGSENVLYSFQGGTDGLDPQGPVLAHKHFLYGTTTQGGGTGCSTGTGCGTVFKVQI